MMPRRFGGQPGRHGEVELAEELVAVFAVELQGEGAVRAGDRVGGSRHERRLEGSNLPRTRRTVGTGVEAEDLGRCLIGQGRVPGEHVGADGVDGAGCWGRHQSSV